MKGVFSAITSDGLSFEFESGAPLFAGQLGYDGDSISAAEVIPPESADDRWTMVYSAWQDAPPGAVVSVHPSQDPEAVAKGLSEDFAEASIAVDMAGFRSRIFIAY